jgi:hypothetical protein
MLSFPAVHRTKKLIHTEYADFLAIDTGVPAGIESVE